MNFDELKSNWNNEKSNDVHIPSTMDKLNLAQHPLDKLKRNMKNEFYTQVIAVLFLAFLPYLLHLPSNFHLLYYIIYAMFLVISVYYLYSFYRFYKSMSLYTMATKDSLLEIYYELRLNMERYKSFSFSLLPFATAFLGLYAYSKALASGKSFDFLSDQNLLLIMIFIVVLCGMIMLATNWWINSFYGKYAKKIGQILVELKEE